MSATIPASPAEVYRAWVDARTHSAVTGSKATSQARVGGRHSAYDGYIHGWHFVLEPGRKVVQSWRTTDFAAADPDSVLELRFARTREGTKVTLVHKDVPAGQGEGYAQGWTEYYFEPMCAYFEKGTSKGRKKAR